MIRFLAAAALSLAALPALAAPVSFDGTWKTQKFSLFSSNTYGFNGSSVSVASNGSVSLAYRPLPESYWGASSAKWSWSVQEGVPATDLRKKGGDDRNLALYFVFLPESEAQALKGASVRQLLSNDAARVLVYVWGGAHNRGAVLSSPYLGNRGKTIVLRGSGTGSANESVNLARDYANAFGGGGTALVGLALSGDSDDTDSRIRASISGLSVN
ncbi:DUF3047 domain-containing protein [Marivita sp.]|uniref:DUF3047 domain-containing protein n=1 Tax=Marivita sp. TaxID=2003365 RepID=UPI0026017D76|nr:DUF3047 domain-containing protein [Marivita sp.]